MTRALAALAAAALLAGCALPLTERRVCVDPFPLGVSAWPAVGDPSAIDYVVQLWNCTDDALLLRGGVCGAGDVLQPRVEHDGETFVLGFNATALPADRIDCAAWPHMREAEATLEPGHSAGANGRWDGTVWPLDAEAPVRLPEGNVTLVVEGGGYRETVEVALGSST